jgi:hypothetical protein
MNLSELTRVMSLSRCAPETSDLAAFVCVADAHYAAHGYDRTVALACDETSPRLAELGFELRARYLELTLSVDLVPALSDHIKRSYR